MFALRSFARALPRVVPRTPAIRVFSKALPIQSSRILQGQIAIKSFSTSIAFREPAGESDQLLSAKFEHEQQLEVDEQDPNVPTPEIEAFLSSSPFKFQDNPGTQLVTLTRQFGNETIKIEFNIADINQIEEDFDALEDDGALPDEEFQPQGKRTINQSGTKDGKIDVAPEDSIAPSDGESGLENGSFQESSYPLGLAITISKPSAGATFIRARAEDGAIEIDSINYFANASLLDPTTPDQARDAQAVYDGPPFMNLDEELQTMLYQYLEERDINARLATFLPEYVSYKEQKEYVQWLGNMKKFIDA